MPLLLMPAARYPAMNAGWAVLKTSPLRLLGGLE